MPTQLMLKSSILFSSLWQLLLHKIIIHSEILGYSSPSGHLFIKSSNEVPAQRYNAGVLGEAGFGTTYKTGLTLIEAINYDSANF